MKTYLRRSLLADGADTNRRPWPRGKALRPSWALGIALAAILSIYRVVPAWGYPQWQLSTGAARCNQCHYAPAGGGLLTSYGRDAVGDQLSTFGGNGAFLHGAVPVPSWLAVGGDLRGAFVDHAVQDPNGATVAVFPMQADASARLSIPGTGLSGVGTIGLRGQVRDPNLLVPIQNYQPISTSRLISREHYLMFQPEVIGTYLRVGRFFAPFGLRVAEHNLYVRRDLGFDQLRETYNFSAGIVQDSWEAHVTVFAPDFLRHIGSDEHGAAAYSEFRVAEGTAAIAGQARIAVGPGATRFIFGAVGKAYLERARTLFFTEVNLVHQVFDDPGVRTRRQAVGAAGVTILPLPSLPVTLLGERNQIDIGIPDAWTAANVLVNWFPYAHCEAQLVGRLQFPSGGDVAKTLFFQVHYFL
jgi:hypothetical protein